MNFGNPPSEKKLTDSIALLESFSAVKLTLLESFRALG